METMPTMNDNLEFITYLNNIFNGFFIKTICFGDASAKKKKPELIELHGVEFASEFNFFCLLIAKYQMVALV